MNRTFSPKRKISRKISQIQANARQISDKKAFHVSQYINTENIMYEKRKNDIDFQCSFFNVLERPPKKILLFSSTSHGHETNETNKKLVSALCQVSVKLNISTV